MTRTEVGAILLAVASLGACAAHPPTAAPRPMAVAPASGFSAGGDVVIAGESFEVRPVQRLSGRGSDVDARFRAWLGSTELVDVVWVDARTLRARIPPGLAVGGYDLTVEGPYGRGVLAGAFEVLLGAPAALDASLALPATAGVGETFDAAVTVSNLGEATVTAVRPQLTASGAGAATLLAAAGAQDVPAGTARTFVSRYRATGAGDLVISASVSGADPRTGGPLSASASGRLVLQGRAELDATLSIPSGAIALGEFPVTLTLSNIGDLAATSIAVTTPALVPASTSTALPGSAPTIDATLGSGGTVTFTWPFRAVASGTLQLGSTVSWTDATGAPRSATMLSNVATVAELAEVLAVDPFLDGSTFAYVAAYRGQVYVGPNQTGTALVRVPLDGSAPEPLALSVAQDRTGNVSTNTAPPYTSIGFTGCTPSGAIRACGPDGEDGRGLLTSVTFAGDEWLLAGGARSAGELDYVYMSRASASPLAFSYVDVGSLLGAATRGFTAAATAGDRLYLGFADNGGSRPYGLALLTPPAPPGLDAVQGVHALELGLHDAYNVAYGSFTTISMVDAIAELNGRVYFFDNTGCIGSKTATPATKDDFFACSPTAGVDYALSSAVAPTRQYDLEPRDRAWPAVAVWNGRLFAIRNTTAGPQLWCCDPGARGDPLVCEPGDWFLVGGDATYRVALASPTATAASLLVGTPTHLFVGFDDPVAGLRVFRTRVARPTAAADFTGRGGCVAGTVGCEGLGGDGLGAALTRIFDAKAIATPEGRTDVFVSAGNGTDPVQVVRLAP